MIAAAIIALAVVLVSAWLVWEFIYTVAEARRRNRWD